MKFQSRFSAPTVTSVEDCSETSVPRTASTVIFALPLSRPEIIAEGIVNVLKKFTPVIIPGELITGFNYPDSKYGEYVIPEDAPDKDEVTTEMERAVQWTAEAVISLGVLVAYQGARYKKLKDGDLDDEIPADELSDDLPDVDWVESEKKSKNS